MLMDDDKKELTPEELRHRYSFRNTFKTIEEFFSCLEKYSENYIFRGVCDSSFNLRPSLYRNIDLDSYTGFLDAEEAHNDFLNYLKYYMKLNLLEAYCYSQHFGMKTKLLDFSINPFVGLLFACKNWGEEEKLEVDGILYIVDKTNLKDVNKDNVDVFKELYFKKDESTYGLEIDNIKVDLENIYYLSPSEIANNKDEDHPLKRLDNQKGCFLVFPKMCSDIWDLKDYKKVFFEKIFVIPSEDKKEIIKHLEEKGITMALMKGK